MRELHYEYKRCTEKTEKTAVAIGDPNVDGARLVQLGHKLIVMEDISDRVISLGESLTLWERKKDDISARRVQSEIQNLKGFRHYIQNYIKDLKTTADLIDALIDALNEGMWDQR